jgi:glutamate--cysteine ligase
VLKKLLEKEKEIIDWLAEQKITFHHYYSSIDLRENNYKASPVDINLFPSGFNNFDPKILQEVLGKTLPLGKKVGLVAENFSRNEKYLANINNLKTALELLGLEVSLLTIEEGRVITLEGLSLSKLDYLLLNNDLTEGAPKELFSLPSLPNPLFGWYKRKKSCHFEIYNNLVAKMAQDLNFDPWFLTTYLDKASGIDFKNKIGLDILAEKASSLLEKIKLKYQEYQIKDKPYLFIKAEAGTFGLGVLKVDSVDQLLNINKKNRHSLAYIKDGTANNDVMLQEGIITALEEEGKPAERVLYQIQDLTLGSLIRYNERKNSEESLNSPGMMIKFLGPMRKLDIIICGLVNLTLEKEFLLLSNQSS